MNDISWSAWPDRGRLAISLGQSVGEMGHFAQQIYQSWNFAKILSTIYYLTYLGQPGRTGAVWQSASVKVGGEMGHFAQQIYQSWNFAKMISTTYYLIYLGQPGRTGAVWQSALVKVGGEIGHLPNTFTSPRTLQNYCVLYSIQHISVSLAGQGPLGYQSWSKSGQNRIFNQWIYHPVLKLCKNTVFYLYTV